MRIFSALYARTMRWSRHRHAPWYLGGVSFAESSFFPIPPDVMLAPMSLANPSKAWRFALITTPTSVAGGLSGYAIGYFAFDALEPWLRGSPYWDSYLAPVSWFERWGFLVAGLMAWGGARMDAALHRTIDRLGWVTVALVVVGAIVFHWSGMS